MSPTGDARRPLPFRQFVLKTHSRCNLACTYCYLYTGPDGTWRDRPRRMSRRTAEQVAERIGAHASRHGIERLRVDLHGGEPLLTGTDQLLETAGLIRAAVPADCSVVVTVQTNGTLLTERALDALEAADLRIGLSLDGGTAALNTRRVDHAGAPSWPAAARAARLLARRPRTYAGLLCTLDVRSDPQEVYSSLSALGPPTLDFLLPHANWSRPPLGIPRARVPTGRGARPVPYGRWLARAFDLWWREEPLRFRIRLFSEIVALLFGVPSSTESVGLSPMATAVVDTDGAIEQTDSLRSAYDKASATGLDVFRHDFEQAMALPGNLTRQSGVAALGDVCRSCPVVHVCGGGNYAHRYLAGAGFGHPSVYCADLEHLIRHIADAVHGAVAQRDPAAKRSAPKGN